MMNVDEVFCKIDDFHKEFEPEWKKGLIVAGKQKRQRKKNLSDSEIMTIIILFQQSCYRHFKAFYTKYILVFFKHLFPKLVSYPRFVAIMGSVLVPLCAYMSLNKGSQTGISFVDSTPISVCHNRRIRRNKVFKGVAERGKCSMGWFFGFKLHLIVNDKGEILSFYISPGGTNDRTPLKKMAKGLVGKLFGDKGYISKKLFDELFQQGLQLITNVRSNMKNRLLPVVDKLLLRKRFIIETINDQLKNISQIEHSRHRSHTNFLMNIISALIAYSLQEKKPSLNISRHVLTTLGPAF